jgi:hypothetical protein
MPTIAEIRQQYPQYKDMTDDDLAGAIHSKFYSDMPREEFNQKIGYHPVGYAEDVLKSAGAGLVKGVAGVAGLPSAIGDAIQWGERKILGESPICWQAGTTKATRNSSRCSSEH